VFIAESQRDSYIRLAGEFGRELREAEEPVSSDQAA
jgi:hypothetical protein